MFIYEKLTKSQLDDNHGDYSRCESLWEPIDNDEVDAILTAYMKPPFIGKQIISKSNLWIMLEQGKVLVTPSEDVRLINTETKKCPLCGNHIIEPCSSISRRDNQTMICPDCGVKEALADWAGVR